MAVWPIFQSSADAIMLLERLDELCWVTAGRYRSGSRSIPTTTALAARSPSRSMRNSATKVMWRTARERGRESRRPVRLATCPARVLPNRVAR
jgi:hypothetical protein